MTTKVKLFISFFNDISSGTWVSLAQTLLASKFDVYDYRETPGSEPDLAEALRHEIAQSDVFICLLSEKYANNTLTRLEFDAAVKASTGSSNGSLLREQGRPLVYVMACDDWAVSEISRKQPGFTYHRLKQYDFQTEGAAGPVPLKSKLWDAWIDNMRRRLAGSVALRAPAEPPTAAGGPRAVLGVLGRPGGNFAEPFCTARDDLAGRLAQTPSVIHVPDGWHDGRSTLAVQAVKAVVAGSAHSLLVQPCDEQLYEDNQTEGLSPGADFGLKLRQVRLSAEDADAALKRTLFWVPKINDVDPAVEPTVPPLDEPYFASVGPWFGTEGAAKLAAWIRRRFGDSALVLRAEDGIDHITRDLRRGLEPFFRSTLLFETVKRENIATSILRTASERRPMVIAIHDWKVAEIDDNPRERIHANARETDLDIQRIQQQGGTDSSLRIARAIFLFRHADKFEGIEAITPWEQWTLVPLDTRKEDYAPPRERLQRIRNVLQLDAGDDYAGTSR
jgi:hypothetical protein